MKTNVRYSILFAQTRQITRLREDHSRLNSSKSKIGSDGESEPAIESKRQVLHVLTFVHKTREETRCAHTFFQLGLIMRSRLFRSPTNRVLSRVAEHFSGEVLGGALLMRRP